MQKGFAAYICAVKKHAPYRLTALLIVLAVLFTQVGVNLLHNHRGIPPTHPSALNSTADNSAANCNACALDGMPILYAEESPLFDFTTFLVPPASVTPEGQVVLVAELRSGRAPPIC